ncbi:MAG: site-specific integrase [Scytonema sp. PMC 1070.18]|nr:site-specific integrase [Scytonema sp. PMC 1070.18]
MYRQITLLGSHYPQEWLKENTKKFIQYLSSHSAFGTIYHYLASFVCFSGFLNEISCINRVEDINRIVIVDYLSYLSRKKLSPSTIRHRLAHFSNFFETGNINKWFTVDNYLIRSEDYPQELKPLPRHIPEEVIQQLNKHIDELPEPIMRMLLVLQETGMRISELCQLPINCLKHDGKGQWWIQFIRWKMKTEDTIPITSELVKVIQEQQQYIYDHLGQTFECLFCSRRMGGKSEEFIPFPKIINSECFIKYIKRLSLKHNITDCSGKLWDFQCHQFRHTVGTTMINNGVPHHIIQRYLGHSSPAMTMRYTYIYDETLRKEVEKYHESKVVNFQGETVELEETILTSNDDLEWFKKNVQARALEHGYCARPKVLGDCDIPGFDGCYNCPHWRTNKNFLPILKDTLERTNKVLEKARNCGWELQVNKNQPIKDNLEKVIKSLEADND